MTGPQLVWAVFVWEFMICLADGATHCSLFDIFSCSEGETCSQQGLNSSDGVCLCRVNFTRFSFAEGCLPVNTKPHARSYDFSTGVSASAIAVGLLVPLFSLCIIGGLVLAARRYRWVHRFREQAHQLSVGSYDTVLVDQVG